MRPILFDATETAFTSHGLGTIADAVSCQVSEKLNGSYELTLEIPPTSKRFALLQPRRLILAKPNPFDQAQPFRIYRGSKTSKGTVKFSARHLSYDLDGIPVGPFTAASASEACWYITHYNLVSSPFDVATDMTVSGSMEVKAPTVGRALLGDQSESLLKKFGGQLRFDRYNVQLLQRRGADRGARILYGKNLIDLSQEENIGQVYTGILPYWQTDDALVTGAIQYAPGTFPFQRIQPVSFNDHFEEQPTAAQLEAAAQQYIQVNEVGKPQVSIRASFIPPGSSGVKHLEEIALGDTVTVRFAPLGIDVQSTVTGCEWDVLRERYTSVKIGDPPPTAAQAIMDAGRLRKGTLKENVIGARSIGGGKIKQGGVGTTELGDEAVTTPKVLGHAVTWDKMEAAVYQFYTDQLRANEIYGGVITSAGNVACNTLTVGGRQFVERTVYTYSPATGQHSAIRVLGENISG